MTTTIKTPFPPYIGHCRVMVFVDGENLAIRYGAALGDREPFPHVAYKKGVYVWSRVLNMERHVDIDTVRRYYYTSATGSGEDREIIREELNELGLEAPRVFQKYKQRGSKRVDISLAVDMLTHAHRKNYDLAVLVAGDEDYVPLVEAAASEGRQVCLWFLENGLSPALRNAADYYFDLGQHVLLLENAEYYL